MIMSDQELISLIKSSSDLGYRALVKEYGNYVYTIVMNRVRNIASHTDIEECVSDVFIDALKDIEKLESSKVSVKSAVATIATRQAIDLFRKLSLRYSRNISYDSEEISLSDISSSPEIRTEEKLESTDIWKKVAELGEPDSTILVLQYFYKIPARKIANRLSMTTAAVNKRSLRARNKLKDILGKGRVY